MLSKFRKIYKPVIWVMIVVFLFSILASVLPLLVLR